MLSELQQDILKTVYNHGARCPRNLFLNYYKRPAEAEVKIVTRSLERLIAKGLIVGFGHKTAEKWYTDKVSLTARGKKEARLLFGRQQTLPLRPRSK